MVDTDLTDQVWDGIDDYHDSDDAYEDEENDVLGDLASLKHLRTPGIVLSQSSSSDASQRKDHPGLSVGGVSASTGTFVSAKTNQSNQEKLDTASYGTSYFSTSPFSQKISREIPVRSKANIRQSPRGPMSLGSSTDYMKILEESGLLPTVDTELNWSGRKPGTGQHVEYQPYEAIPLEPEGLIFCSATARIEKVKCRRILLARKSMTCHQKMTLEDAMNEVKHLHKLRHAHIVQLVGSYIQGKTFAVLLYPVADLDLKDFLQRIESVLVPHRAVDYGNFMAIASLGRFFKCLASALGYVHSQTTKHMDIKPRNVLIKRSNEVLFGFQVYLADFGISRSFSSTDQSQTDAWVGRTAKYCAPEVHWNESHGRAADIFSLGCVFLEMQTVLCGHPLDDLYETLEVGSPASTFHANLPHIFQWIKKLTNNRPVFVTASEEDLQQEVFAKYPFEGVTDDGRRGSISRRHISLCTLIHAMMQEDPLERPRITDIIRLIGKSDCCDKGQEPFRSETATAVGPIDASVELNRLFRKRHQVSAAEREEILQHIVESGNQQLSETFLRYFVAHHLEPSESLKLKAVQASFVNDDFALLKILVTTLNCEALLETILVGDLSFISVDELKRLIETFKTESKTFQGIKKLLPEAVRVNRRELVACMMEHGFHCSDDYMYGNASLDAAIDIGSKDLAHLLLKENTRLRQAVNDRAMLSKAVLHENYQLAVYLLGIGADPRISVFGKEQPDRTVLHDIILLDTPDKPERLHLARLTIMVCDCRDVVAHIAQDSSNNMKKFIHGTPWQIGLALSNSQNLADFIPWVGLLKYNKGPSLMSHGHVLSRWEDPEDIEELVDLRARVKAVKVEYLIYFSERWEKYMFSLQSISTVQNIVCLDDANDLFANPAYVFIIREVLQLAIGDRDSNPPVFVEENYKIWTSVMYANDTRFIYKKNLTQFSNINRHSIVICLNPEFAARQAFADLLPAKGYPAAIICETVDMITRSYPPLGPSNDPNSQGVQDFFRNYTAHDLTNPGLDPNDDPLNALSNITLYLRRGIHKVQKLEELEDWSD